jgi:hypothetical protein
VLPARPSLLNGADFPGTRAVVAEAEEAIDAAVFVAAGMEVADDRNEEHLLA